MEPFHLDLAGFEFVGSRNNHCPEASTIRIFELLIQFFRIRKDLNLQTRRTKRTSD